MKERLGPIHVFTNIGVRGKQMEASKIVSSCTALAFYKTTAYTAQGWCIFDGAAVLMATCTGKFFSDIRLAF